MCSAQCDASSPNVELSRKGCLAVTRNFWWLEGWCANTLCGKIASRCAKICDDKRAFRE